MDDLLNHIYISEDEQDNEQQHHHQQQQKHLFEANNEINEDQIEGEGTDLQYKDRKPKWWRQLAGRRGSRAQRRANQTMGSYKLPSIPYGTFYDFSTIFPSFGSSSLLSSSLDTTSTKHQEHQEEEEQQQQIWLEIGSGQGDVLLANAERHSHVWMIGADIHKPGIGSTLLRIESSLKTGKYWKDYNLYTESKNPFAETTSSTRTTGNVDEKNNTNDPFNSSCIASSSTTIISTATPTMTGPDHHNYHHDVSSLYSNVRIFPGDGMKLLHYIPTSSMDRILMTFPDPWAHGRHCEHRLLQTHTIHDLYRVLKHGGRFCLVTDHEVFLSWALELFALLSHTSETEKGDDEQNDHKQALFRKIEMSPNQVNDNRMEWLPVISKYEQKGWNEGRPSHLVCWEAIKA